MSAVDSSRDVDPDCLDALIDAEGPNIRKLLHEAQALANGKGSHADRFDRLFDIADKVSKAITPHTPCKGGCSHCCHMAVAISDYEAAAISRYTGLLPAIQREVSSFLTRSDDNTEAYAGDSCPFLAPDGKCGIYPVRPIACRTHHNLAKDSENCRVKDTPNPLNTPILDLTAINYTAVDITMSSPRRGFGDIREYFPKESA